MKIIWEFAWQWSVYLGLYYLTMAFAQWDWLWLSQLADMSPVDRAFIAVFLVITFGWCLRSAVKGNVR